MRVYATAMNHENTRFALTEGEKILSTLENCLQVPYALPKMDQIFILRLGKGDFVASFDPNMDGLDSSDGL